MTSKVTHTGNYPDPAASHRLLAAISAMVVTWACGAAESGLADSPYVWALPPGVDPPPEPEDNPTTLAKVELGQHLFVDKRLSATGQYACVSCHDPALAFSDVRSPSVGLYGDILPRGAPSLANVGYLAYYTWSNPLLTGLEGQALVPLLAKRPAELDIADRVDGVMQQLAADGDIVALFQRAFAGAPQPVTLVNTLRALAAYERTPISSDSDYDRFLSGESRALSVEAERGRLLFFSERLHCAQCHRGRWLSAAADPTSTTEGAFFNTGLYNLGGTGAYPHDNRGLVEFSGRREDIGKFRTPALRNVALTAPYMHDGSVATLTDVIEHYRAGGRTIADGPRAGVGAESPYKDPRVSGFTLSNAERADLIAFLEGLTDRSFIAASIAASSSVEGALP